MRYGLAKKLVLCSSIFICSVTYAAGNASLWGITQDPTPPELADTNEKGTNVTPDSSMQINSEAQTIENEQVRSIEDPNYDPNVVIDPPTDPVPTATDSTPDSSTPSVPPVNTQTPPASSKAPSSTKTSKSKSATKSTAKTKGKTVTSTSQAAPSDIDAPLLPIDTSPASQKTVCQAFIQQVSLDNDPQFSNIMNGSILPLSKVVDDQYTFLLSGPDSAKKLYAKYRELYIKTYCTKGVVSTLPATPPITTTVPAG